MVQLVHHGGGWKALTRSLRLLSACCPVLHLTGIMDFNSLVADAWEVVRGWRWCHDAMAEAHVAAGAFFVWIFLFRALDTLPFVKQFRFVPRPAVPPMTFWHESAKAFAGGKETGTTRHVRVWSSLPIYLGAIAILHMIKAVRPLDETPPNALRLVAEVAGGVWAYDFVFYWIHLLMHVFPKLPHGHGVHHELVEATVGETRASFLEAECVVNHSLLDGALQVLVNIMVQNLPLFGMPKHKLSRFIHNALVTYLLVEAHAGLDLPWGSHRVFPLVFGGAFRHELHHQTHKCCFHQFFQYLDDFLGYGPPPLSSSH